MYQVEENIVMDTILDRYESVSSGPKYRALAEAIRQSVSAGDLPPGQKLPPVRELGWTLKMTPGTVARAYTILTDEGVLEAEVGRGTFVAEARRNDVRSWVPVDVAPHGADADRYDVNLVSPALPDVGQAALIRGLLADIAANPPSGIMHYPVHDTARPGREAAVTFLSEVALGRISESDIALTYGAQNAIMMVMQAVLTGRRPVVLIEELAYPGFRRAALLLRAEVVPVPMDADGMDPVALERIARSTGAQLVCLSAEVQNPSLISMPLARRKAVAKVAARCGLHILEDDCYRLGPPTGPTFRALCPDRAWYVTSISKSLTPALRLGFAVAPEGRSTDLRRSVEHGFFGMATPLSDLASVLLVHPDLPQIMADFRACVADYIRSMVNILGRHEITWREDVLFMWLTLPRGWRASTFARAAEAEGVQVRTAEDFADRNTATPHAVRISVNAGVSRARFEAALERLRRLLDNPPERIAV